MQDTQRVIIDLAVTFGLIAAGSCLGAGVAIGAWVWFLVS